MKENKKGSWGGKRLGAGRPAGTDKRVRAFRLNDKEFEQVKRYIKKLRKEELSNPFNVDK